MEEAVTPSGCEVINAPRHEEPGNLKIDLVTWTYNSAKTLDKCLASIDQALLQENICHKIAVDGGSNDETLDVLRKYGWEVEDAPKKGIPYQANRALGLVDREFFASFEHDIILSPDWFRRTSKVAGSDKTVGAVQGIRLYTGSKTMKAIEEWQYRANLMPVWVYSIDNTLFRTEAVKRAGGFSDECMASSDGILRRAMFKLGYKWITDRTLVSGHYRRNFFEHFNHQIRAYELARYFWTYNPESGRLPRRIISMLGGNPKHVLNLTLQSRMLRVPLAWYILRLQKGLYLNLPHENKSMKVVAMDDWYLAKFKKSVMKVSDGLHESDANLLEDAVSATSLYPCAWCGRRTPLVYSIPNEWIGITPKLRPGIGKRFSACSDPHAERIAEKLFKAAFDYVIPGN